MNTVKKLEVNFVRESYEYPTKEHRHYQKDSPRNTKVISIKEMLFIHSLATGVKKQRIEDSNSDQSDNDHLSIKPQTYHKCSSTSSSDSEISNGCSKEHANRGKHYKRKDILEETPGMSPLCTSKEKKRKSKSDKYGVTL